MGRRLPPGGCTLSAPAWLTARGAPVSGPPRPLGSSPHPQHGPLPSYTRALLFTQGFTTREGGHGLGLHSSALAAQMLGGRLTLESDGPGKGATATLELPLV
ncbi:ATP-binding protein [Archangium violaceum]|nr:ATP-binding protein [Archangium gephyra]